MRRVGLDLAANAHDMQVDGAVEDFAVPHVGEIEQPLTRSHPLGITWPELEKAAAKLRASGAPCGFTTHWPSWVNVENFSALHNLPIATEANGFAGLNARLTINNPVLVHHIVKLAEWQKTKLYDYSGLPWFRTCFRKVSRGGEMVSARSDWENLAI